MCWIHHSLIYSWGAPGDGFWTVVQKKGDDKRRRLWVVRWSDRTGVEATMFQEADQSWRDRSAENRNTRDGPIERNNMLG